MSDDRLQNAPARARARPRSRLFLSISPDNPYARLSVSPLAPTSEIIDAIDQRRGDTNRRLRAKSIRAADDPDELLILELDQITELIGEDRRRARYDAKYPQNTLLTVQQSAAEQAWRRHGRAGLVSDWLCEIAGEEAFLPTPRCVKLWAPSGIESELGAVLDVFTTDAAPADAASVTDFTATLSLENLDSLIKGD